MVFEERDGPGAAAEGWAPTPLSIPAAPRFQWGGPTASTWLKPRTSRSSATGGGVVLLAAVLFGVGIGRLSADALKPSMTLEQLQRDKVAAKEMLQ